MDFGWNMLMGGRLKDSWSIVARETTPHLPNVFCLSCSDLRPADRHSSLFTIPPRLGIIRRVRRPPRDEHRPLKIAMRGPYRQTKIIATVRPATESRERLEQLIARGVDVIRLDMAPGPGEWVQALVHRIRDASRTVDRHVAVMMDVKGPEIRTGPVAESIELKADEHFEFYTESPSEGIGGVSVNYPGLANDVQVGA